jgi:hypothetical protein
MLEVSSNIIVINLIERNAQRATTRSAEITALMFEHMFTGTKQGLDQDVTLGA